MSNNLFSIQKVKNRASKYIYQPSTKDGNPLYRKGIGEDGNEIYTDKTVNDAEFKSKITSRYTSPSNVRALYLFSNFALTVLHIGIGTGDDKHSGGRVLTEKCAEKNKINIVQKDNKTLSFGVFKDKAKDKKGVEQTVYDYEDIKPIDSVNDMPLKRITSWKLSNIEELYFDIMYTLNALNGVVGDKVIDLKTVVNELLGNNWETDYPRLKYIGFVDSAKWEDKIANGQLEEAIVKAEQVKGGDITKQVGLDKGCIQFIQRKSPTSLVFKKSNADWYYDKFVQNKLVNDKNDAEILKAKGKEQIENESKEDIKEITKEIFIKNWKNKGGLFRKVDNFAITVELTAVGQEYNNSLEGVIIKGDGKKVVIDEGGQLKVRSKKYVSNNYDVNRADTGKLPALNKIYAVVLVPSEIKRKVEFEGNYCILNNDGASHGQGDYLVCRYDEKTKLPLVEEGIWMQNGALFSSIYQEYVKDENDERVDNIVKEIENSYKKGIQNEGIAFYILSNLEKDSKLKELCIEIYKRINIPIPDKMKSLLHLSKYLNNIGEVDFTNEIRENIKG